MADTSIGWTRGDDGTPGKTWNPTAGCTLVSPGCKNCYAMRAAYRLERMGQQKYAGTAKKPAGGKATWTGKVNLSADSLEDPLNWRKPARIFVNSMSDLFHKDIPDSFIDKVMATVFLATQHTFQVLTKRAERQYRYFADTGPRIKAIAAAVEQYYLEKSAPGQSAFLNIEENIFASWPLPNLWLGVSTENQEWADDRIPWLVKTNAAIRFLSCEPLLGPIDIVSPCGTVGEAVGAGGGCLHWAIAGGESGPGAREMNVGWIRSIVSQCKAGGVACFVKQLGANARDDKNYKFKLRSTKGEDPSEWPADLRIQEYPTLIEA